MTTDALNALFTLLDTDEDDFATLVQRFGIDPAKDLQNCDLSNVDFGRLVADTLDLTGSILQGANLSQVKCKRLIGVEATISKPTPEKPVLDDVQLAIFHYQNSDWALNKVVNTLGSSSAPVLVFYDSTAEQSILTKRLCAHFGHASHVQAGFSTHSLGVKLLWFYSKAGKPQQFRLNPASLEKSFFELLQAGNVSHDIGIYPFTSNQAAVERICKSVRGPSYDQMRTEFTGSLRRELSRQLSTKLAFDPGSVVLFSGFQPISKRLYRDILDAGNGNINLIFLCSSTLEPFYTQDKGVPWRRVAVPAHSVGEPLAVAADIGRLRKRIGIASGGLVTLSENTEAWMRQFVAKPMATLKAELANRLKAEAQSKSVPLVL